MAGERDPGVWGAGPKGGPEASSIGTEGETENTETRPHAPAPDPARHGTEPPAAPTPAVPPAHGVPSVPGARAIPTGRAQTMIGVTATPAVGPSGARPTEPGVQSATPKPGSPVQNAPKPGSSQRTLGFGAEGAGRRPAAPNVAAAAPPKAVAVVPPAPQQQKPRTLLGVAAPAGSPEPSAARSAAAPPQGQGLAKADLPVQTAVSEDPPTAPTDAIAAELRTRADKIAMTDPVGAARALVELGVHHERVRDDVASARRCYEEAHRLSVSLDPALGRLRRLLSPAYERERMLEIIEHEIAAASSDRARADLHAERARVAWILGRPEESRADFEHALRLVPDHPASLRGRETVLREAGGKGAEQALVDHLEVLADRYAPAEGRPDGDARLAAWLLVERAQIAETALGRPDLARVALERAVTLDSAPGPVRSALTRHLVRNDAAPALAAALAAEAEREKDDGRASRLDYAAAQILNERLKTPDEARPIFERAASRAPSNTPTAWRALTHLVDLLEAQGEWEQAASVRQRRLALLADPDAIAFEQVRLSEIFNVVGRADRAALHAARALAHAPDDPATMERLDRALLRLGRHEERLHAWTDQANADRPLPARVAALLRGADIAARHLGWQDDALAQLRAAWSLDPSNQEVFDTLSTLLAAKPPAGGIEAGSAAVRARIDLYAQAAAAAPSAARKLAMWEKLAQLWEDEVGDPSRAIEVLDDVLAVDPRRLSALLAMQRNAERAGQWQKLVSAVVAEAELAEEAALAKRLFLRAADVTGARVGDRERALVWVERALALAPEDPDVLRALAKHSERAGRYDDARRSLVTLAERASDGAAAFSLWMEIASLDELRRKVPADAVTALRAAGRAKPRHPLPRHEITRLLRAIGDPQALARALASLAEDAPSSHIAADLDVAAAEVHLLALGNDQAALERLVAAERRLASDAMDPAIFEWIERILVRRRAPAERADMYRRWLERKPPAAVDHAIRIALAEILVDQGAVQASALLHDLVRVVPTHVPALRMLEHLHRSMEAVRPLVAVLRAEADVFGSRSARCGALWEMVRLLQAAPHAWGPTAPDDTLDALSRVAALDPGDGGALDTILRVAAERRENGAMRSPSLLLTALAAKRELLPDPVARSLLETERCLFLEANAASDPSVLPAALTGFRAALAWWPESLLAARALERLASRADDRASSYEAHLALFQLADTSAERARHAVRAAELMLGLGGQDAEGRATDLYERALQVDADSAPAATALSQLLASQPERMIDRFRAAQEKAAMEAQVVALGLAIGRAVLQMAEVAPKAAPTPRAEGEPRAPAPSIVVIGDAGDRRQTNAAPDVGSAVTAMTRVLRVVPEDVPALLLMARLQNVGRLYPDARDTLLRLLDAGPDVESRTIAAFFLADLYAGPLARLDLAEQQVQGVLASADAERHHKRALGRLFEIAKARGDKALMIQAQARLVEMSSTPSERAEAGMRLADVCLDADQRPSAVRALADAVASAPGDARPWAALARLFRIDTKDGAAGYVDALKTVLEVASTRRLPIDPRWLTTAGLMETTTLGRHPDAIVHLQHAVALPGAPPDARAGLGRALEAACRNVEAIQVLRTLFTVDVETGARIDDVAAALASLEAALAKEGRVDERLSVEEVRACLGETAPERSAWLRGRRLPAESPRIGAFAGAELGRMLLPEARIALVDVCAAMQPVAHKALRLEPSNFGLGSRERVGPRDGHPVRNLADRIGRALGLEAFEMYLSPVWQGPPRACPGDPPAILASTTFADLPEPEQIFSLGRLLARISLGTSFIDELSAEQLDGFILAALRTVEPGFGTGDLLPNREIAAQTLGPAVQRAIGRRQKKQLEEMLPMLVPSFDVRPFLLGIRRSEYRIALLLCGDVLAAIDHLRRVDGSRMPDEGRGLLKHPVSSDLLRFTLTPESCAERRRIGTMLPG